MTSQPPPARAHPNDPDLVDLIHKRITLNLLIQGAAAHTTHTAHHLVRDELNALSPALMPLYDRIGAAMDAYQWCGEQILFTGRPLRFWKRIDRSDHPFFAHPLLARHALTLADAARAFAFKRARSKRVTCIPVLHSFQILTHVLRAQKIEDPHRIPLAQLAGRVAHLFWGIDPDRIKTTLTRKVAFGRLPQPRTTAGFVLQSSAIGFSGVVRSGDRLDVVAKAWIFPVLAHEVIKGVAELVCLHGINHLDRRTYDKVTAYADRIDFEPWMLQLGSELWRRLLPLTPDPTSLAHALMHIARLPPKPLHHLMNAVIDDPDWARHLIAEISAGP